MIPIITYGPNETAPARMKWAAAMVSDGRPGSHWLAVGPTEEAARAKLTSLWAKTYPERRGPKKESVVEDDCVL